MYKKLKHSIVALGLISTFNLFGADQPFQCVVKHWDKFSTEAAFQQKYISQYDSVNDFSRISINFKIGKEDWSLWAMQQGTTRVIQYSGPDTPAGYVQNYELHFKSNENSEYELYVGPQGALQTFFLATINCGPVVRSEKE